MSFVSRISRVSSSLISRSLSRSFSTAPKLNMAQMKLLRDKSGAPMNECKDALVAAMKELEGKPDQEVLDFAIDFLRKKGLNTASKKAGRSANEGLVGIASTSDNKTAIVVEINSETDFSSRSPQFQSLVTLVSDAALNTAAKENNEIDVDTLKTTQVGKITVADHVLDVVTAIRENLQIRRASKLSVTEGVVSSYIHNKAEGTNNAGRVACLVALQSKTDKLQELQEFGYKLAMHAVAAQPQYLSKSEVPKDILDHEVQVLTEQAKLAGKNEAHLQKIVEGRLNKYYEDSVFMEQRYMITEDNKPPKISQLLKDFSKQIGSQVDLVSFVRFAVGEGLKKKEQQSFADEVQSKLQGK